MSKMFYRYSITSRNSFALTRIPIITIVSEKIAHHIHYNIRRKVGIIDIVLLSLLIGVLSGELLGSVSIEIIIIVIMRITIGHGSVEFFPLFLVWVYFLYPFKVRFNHGISTERHTVRQQRRLSWSHNTNSCSDCLIFRETVDGKCAFLV